jgi:hypothetical protein
VLETWTGATGAYGVLVAMGRVFVSGDSGTAGMLYAIDPSQSAGTAKTVTTSLGRYPLGITFDGARIWTANGTSISIVTPGTSLPWSTTTITTGFSSPVGIIYDGVNVWVTDSAAQTLLRLDSGGAVLQTVTAGNSPGFPTFDGTNVWVPNRNPDSVTVVRAATGVVIGTSTGNGLSQSYVAAFDGQRILVPNNGGESISLWSAADLKPLGSISTGAGTKPFGVCSDGQGSWIVLGEPHPQLARF